MANPSGRIVVTDIDRKGRPVGIDERYATTRAHHPRHLSDGGNWVGEPLQSAFGSHDVQAIVRLVERAGIADRETHETSCGTCLRPCEAQHLSRDVGTDDLTVITEILSEDERDLAETTAHVEEPLTVTEPQLISFQCTQSPRRLPPCGGVHRGEQHRHVRIVVHPLEPRPCVSAVPMHAGHDCEAEMRVLSASVDLDFDSTGATTEFLSFLQLNVWSAPQNSPGLAGEPRARVLESVT